MRRRSTASNGASIDAKRSSAPVIGFGNVVSVGAFSSDLLGLKALFSETVPVPASLVAVAAGSCFCGRREREDVEAGGNCLPMGEAESWSAGALMCGLD